MHRGALVSKRRASQPEKVAVWDLAVSSSAASPASSMLQRQWAGTMAGRQAGPELDSVVSPASVNGVACCVCLYSSMDGRAGLWHCWRP